MLNRTKLKIAAAIDGNFQYEELPVLTRRQDVAMLEASIMDKTEYGHPLNLRDLVKYELIATGSFKPVLVPTQKRLLPSDLLLLREVESKYTRSSSHWQRATILRNRSKFECLT